jgi:N-methylhydantoinase A
LLYRIGVDVGGTFTDFVVYSEDEEKIRVFKIHSDKNTPWLPIVNMINKEIKNKANIADIRHGTTIGVNAIIERKAGKTALLTTSGFRDLLEIGRQRRPHLYNLHIKKPYPLVPRYLRIPITERIDNNGRVISPLNKKEVLESIDKLKQEKVESVAVLFLNSYANGKNEEETGKILKKNLPGAYISLSSEVIPEFREYERLSTTVLNACIGPLFKNYLDNFLSELEKLNIRAPLFICQSDGGLISPEGVTELPVRTLFSGPAAGVIGASFLYGSGNKQMGDKTGEESLITLDMGGTSTDVAIISGSNPVKTTEKEIMGYPVKFPAVDVSTIGAGGGSIAAVDEGGFLRVGPGSSGAEPGPACYDRGGDNPTVTDANLVLGTIGIKTMLGGKMKLNPDRAKEAIKSLVSGPLNISLIEGAWSIIRIVTSDISEAIRKITISKGLHPADLELVAYGGAGPMHAAMIAKELGIARIIIPEIPGAFSAEGLLYSNSTIDFVKTIKGAKKESISGIISNFKSRAEKWFRTENIPSGRRRLEWSLDIRYKGQNYELNIPVSAEDIKCLEDYRIDAVKEIFYKKHYSVYGYKLEDRDIEIINLRLRCTGVLSLQARHRIYREIKGSKSPGKIARKFRDVYFTGDNKSLKTPVYERRSLPEGFVIKGPAIIEQFDSTIVIPQQSEGRVIDDGSIILRV